MTLSQRNSAHFTADRPNICNRPNKLKKYCKNRFEHRSRWRSVDLGWQRSGCNTRSLRKDGFGHSDCVDVSLRAAGARFRITFRGKKMRSTIVLSTVLAVSTALVGACGSAATNTTPNKPENKPVATPLPVQPTTPVNAPPVAPPADTKESKDAKDAKQPKPTDLKAAEKDKETKPAAAETPKK